MFRKNSGRTYGRKGGRGFPLAGRAGPENLVAWCEIKTEAPLMTNIRRLYINCNYNTSQYEVHLKMFLLTLLDAKSVVIESVSISSSSCFSVYKVAKSFNLS